MVSLLNNFRIKFQKDIRTWSLQNTYCLNQIKIRIAGWLIMSTLLRHSLTALIVCDLTLLCIRTKISPIKWKNWMTASCRISFKRHFPQNWSSYLILWTYLLISERNHYENLRWRNCHCPHEVKPTFLKSLLNCAYTHFNPSASYCLQTTK